MTLGRLAILTRGVDFSCGLIPELIDKCVEFIHGVELDAFAAFDLLEAVPCGLAEPGELGPFLLLSPFQEAQALAYNLTGIAVAALPDAHCSVVDPLVGGRG